MTAKQDLGLLRPGKRELAEKSRDELRFLRLDDPGVFAGKTTMDGLLNGNHVPKALLDLTDITIKLESYDSANPHDDDSYQIRLRNPDTGIATTVGSGDLGPIADRKWPLVLTFPSSELLDNKIAEPSTAWDVGVRVINGDTENPTVPQYLTIRVDRFAPYQNKQTGDKSNPARVSFVNPAPGSDLDSEWLLGNDHIEIDVPTTYGFYNLTDQVIIYFADTYSQTAPPTAAIKVPLLSHGRVRIPVKDIPEALTNGTWYAYCAIEDYSGNISLVSLERSITVRIQPDAVLRPPRIPSAIKPDALDLKDLQSHVYAEVDRPVNGLGNDKVRLYVALNTPTATPILVGEKFLSNLRVIQFELFYDQHLKTLFGASDIDVDAKVYYEFVRGIAPPRKSPEQDFLIDFSYAGPDTGDLPDLTNKNMVKVTVIGNSGVANVISAEDLKGPIWISTPMKEAADTWTPEGNEECFLVYEGNRFGPIALLGGETEIKRQIPANIMEKVGPGFHNNNYWEIQYVDGRNTMSSQLQTVEVEKTRITFEEPTFPLNSKGDVNCLSLEGDEGTTNLWLPVTVDIIKAYMPPTTIITVHSYCAKDLLGLEPIAGTEFSEPYEIQGAEPDDKFVINVKPYLTKIKPAQPTQDSGQEPGSINVWYEVPVAGEVIDSTVNRKKVTLLSDDKYCEG
ncbi:hypothetical protein [Pseudomonas sp. H3(2019)]|uniref:hypothetical protein n=1 Tax=Pseudomonas sp. H3(2019) TaxID=2598724 RepID=UPI0011931D06|nr:hypothetical protein [Pseudomonas sp. H3(2019)]TVT80337.1 hypothetical protein FPT12_23330 [Pseudomonas sp. H3(2019)]